MGAGANGLSRRTLGAGAKKELPRERSEELAGGWMLSWPEILALSLSNGSGANGLSRRGQLEALVVGAGSMAVWSCLASVEELAGG